MDHTVLPANYTPPLIVTVHQIASGGGYLIAAYYSLIDPERMKG